jgi:FtsZ-binding cell division protein ZapB
MKTLELPYICFGRNKGNVTDFYDIREQSSSIPEEIVTFFRDRITKSIQWESSEETANYVDCFLIWRVNHSGFLFAKLADGGSDSLKRNHSMQIDAVYLTNEQLPDTTHKKASFFASLCSSSVWEHWEKCKILQPVDENEQKVTELSGKLLDFFTEKTLSVHSLFLASHQYFTPCGIDQIVYNIHNDKKSLNQKSIPVETQPVKFSVSPQERPFLYISPLVQYICFVLIILLILSVIVIGWTAFGWYIEARQWQTEYDLLQKKYEKTIIKLTSSSKKLEGCTEELTNVKKIVKEQSQQIEKKNSEIETLKEDKNNLNSRLQTARRNADESLKNENESLKNQNEQLHKKINIIHNHVENIRNELLSEK